MKENDPLIDYFRRDFQSILKILNMSEKVVYAKDGKIEVLKDESRRVC